MISDFICISLLNHTSEIIDFSLELPDIYNDDDVMISCGRGKIEKDVDGFSLLTIYLSEDFYELCIGESYNRDALIESVIANISIETKTNYLFSEIKLVDNMGEYIKSFY